MIIYMPPNLAQLGLKRKTQDGIPDLITIWKTPYPVLTRFKLLLQDMGIDSFSGWEYQRLKPGQAGYATSGYRDVALEGRANSPHCFALALDVAVGDYTQQIKWGMASLKYFERVGLYPQNGVIHIDLCNKDWMEKYNGKRFWVRHNGLYTSFDEFSNAAQFSKLKGESEINCAVSNQHNL